MVQTRSVLGEALDDRHGQSRGWAKVLATSRIDWIFSGGLPGYRLFDWIVMYRRIPGFSALTPGAGHLGPWLLPRPRHVASDRIRATEARTLRVSHAAR